MLLNTNQNRRDPILAEGGETKQVGSTSKHLIFTTDVTCGRSVLDFHRISHDAAEASISAYLSDGDVRDLYKTYECSLLRNHSVH